MEMKQLGGGASASPIIKAVLDNLGRRYLVEHQEAEDGSWWADRYSDGWVRQAVIITKTNPEITFPIAFATSNYHVTLGSYISESAYGTGSVQSESAWDYFGCSLQTATSIRRGGNKSLDDRMKVYVVAEGYAV